MSMTPRMDAIGIDHLTATEREYKLRKLVMELEAEAARLREQLSFTAADPVAGGWLPPSEAGKLQAKVTKLRKESAQRFTIDEIADYLGGWTIGGFDEVKKLGQQVAGNALQQLRHEEDGIAAVRARKQALAAEQAEPGTYRAGDHVHHKPTGEDWVVACDEEGGKIMPSGWPCCLADAADCSLLKAATDDERLETLKGHAKAGQGYEGERDPRTITARQQLAAEIKKGGR